MSFYIKIGADEQRNAQLHYYHLETAKELTHPQTKSLPWITTCKTGQPNSFGYETMGSLEAHSEARRACSTSASSCGKPKSITLVRG